MKLRAITLGYDVFQDDSDLGGVREKLTEIQTLKRELEQLVEVEYVRLATSPFTVETSPQEARNQFLSPHIPERLEELVSEGLMGIYSYCPGLLDHPRSMQPGQKLITNHLVDILSQYPNMFSSLQVGSTIHGINFQAVEEATKVFFGLAKHDPFSNVQFAVTFNVPENTPFFPSAYHDPRVGSSPKISLALEAADELVSIFSNSDITTTSLFDLKLAIQNRFSQIGSDLSSIVEPFCIDHGLKFKGIDFSPAPYPTLDKSIGNALEQLGFTEFGGVGSVFSVGFITQALQSIASPKIGFSGFMQPLLEDYIIAQRNNEGKVDLTKLLLYSTMCGLGLDCAPIPGNTPPDAVKLLLLDLGMMSMRLKKPLTARLMPIPQKVKGEMTPFDFEYFTNSQICGVDYYPRKEWADFRKKNQSYKF
ncbi:MAG: DUF711 family protein [Promethearchaeota archaeon]